MFRVQRGLERPVFIRMGKNPLMNRDVSWFQFNERVLEEAIGTDTPLIETLKFLGISASNLDEFFMIRVAAIEKELRSKRRNQALKTLQDLREVKSTILKQAKLFSLKQKDALRGISEKLKELNIYVVYSLKNDTDTRQVAKEYFEKNILPSLPFTKDFDIKDLERTENLKTVALLDNGWYMRLPRKMPGVLIHPHENGRTYIFFLDQLILEFFQEEGHRVCALVRLTRDGDYQLDLGDREVDYIPQEVETRIEKRDLGDPIRLQYLGVVDSKLSKILRQAFGIQKNEWLPAPDTLYLQTLKSLQSGMPENLLQLPRAQFPKFQERHPLDLSGQKTIFDQVKEKDILLHHPYDSFNSYIEWIKAACEDPNVESIEQTLYRIDTLSPVITALKKAAAHKQVRILIELRARFDEENNLKIAKELKAAGAKVRYGFGALKLHAKVALVTRVEGDQKVHYTHLSTGNYHAVTARQYTDLAILTAKKEIGEDARHFFDSLYERRMPQQLQHLILAPRNLVKRMLTLIEQEREAALAGKKARVVAKVNALVDPQIIKALYRASQDGVQVDLIVRGACSLVPGVPGVSDNIRVISIVDRFLEHSRIYYFENSGTMYLSSADWMPRNFHSRVEIAFPVLDSKIFHHIANVILPIYLADNVKARELTSEGSWVRKPKSEAPIHAQSFFMNPIA